MWNKIIQNTFAYHVIFRVCVSGLNSFLIKSVSETLLTWITSLPGQDLWAR